MHIVYVDESSDQNAGVTIISALMLPAETWSQSFARMQRCRCRLKQSDGRDPEGILRP